MPGRVSAAERKQADALRRQVARFERRSIAEAARLAGRVVPKILKAFRGGGDLVTISEIIDKEVDRAEPVLTETMVLAHLIGTRQIVESVPAVRAAAVHTDAVNSLQRRLHMTNAELAALSKKYSEQAVVALQGVNAELNMAVSRTVARITEQGLTTREGVKRMRESLSASGISGAAEFGAKPYLVETVMRTQTQIAYATGRYQEEQDPAYQEILWGYKYATAGDDRVRDSHAAMDGTTAPKGDPIWIAWTPPNGFNCRCGLVPLFEPREVDKPDSVVIDKDTIRERTVPVGEPDPGFDVNFGQVFGGQPIVESA